MPCSTPGHPGRADAADGSLHILLLQGIDDVFGVEAFDEDGALGSLPHLLLVARHCFGGKVDLGTKSTYSYVGLIRGCKR